MNLLVELVGFVRERKKYLLAPILLLILLFGGLVVAGYASGLGPLIYALF